MTLPRTMRALKNTAPGEATFVTNAPIPSIPEDYILVKVSHIGLNPTDWKHIDYLSSPGSTVGCDFAGVVAEVGDNVHRQWTIGDRVAGISHGNKKGSPDSGAFGDYCLMKSTMGIKIPDSMSDAEAATLGVGTLTVGQALYQALNLPWPDQIGRVKCESILIHGGSTTTGLLAIQWAKLSGFHVLTTCSPRNNELVRSAGADEVFDYHDRDACSAAIRAATNDKLLYAFDAVSEGDSYTLCNNALTTEKGRAQFVALYPYDLVRPEDDVFQQWIFIYTTWGEEFEDIGKIWNAQPNDAAFARRFWLLTEEFCTNQKLKLFPVIREGGLTEEGVLTGIDDLRKRKISGGKLVYKI